MLRQILFFLFQAASLLLCSQPVITSFSPTKAPVSSTVTITGTGFNNDPQKNAVWFGSVKANIVSATSTSLVVTVPVAAGSESYIQVAANGLNAFSSIPFQQLAPTGSATSTISFDSSVIINIKNIYYAWLSKRVVIEDVDMDGRPDLLLTDSTNRLIIYRNISTNNTISFENNPTIFKLNQNPFVKPMQVHSFSMADMNGDGIKDFVFAEGTQLTLPSPNTGAGVTKYNIIINNSKPGIISLNAEKRFYQDFTWYFPTIYLKDINMDGKTDIVQCYEGKGNTAISYMDLSRKDSSVSYYEGLNVSFVQNCYPFDFNNDARVDIISVPTSFTNFFYFSLLRNKQGTDKQFQTLQQVFSGKRNSSAALRVSDLDQDGKLDILMSGNGDFNYQTPTIVPPNRPTSFTLFRNISTSDSIMFDTVSAGREMFLDSISRIGYFELYDLNRDGLSDIVFQDTIAKRLKIYWNTSTTGNIRFSNSPVLVNYKPFAGKLVKIMPSDLNGDGWPDITMLSDQGEFIILSNNTGARETNFNSLIPTSVDSSLFVYRSSTENPSGATTLTVFPNPVKNILTVKKPQSSNTYTVNINGINGMVRFVNKPIDNGIQLQINVSTLPSGVYTITLFDKAGSVAGRAKFIK